MADFELQPIQGATFGAVVTDLRLAEINDQAFEALYAAWLAYALLIFPNQHLSKPEQIAFARRFGDMEFDLAPISNLRADGSVRSPEADDDVLKVLKGNMVWHCDSTYMPVQAKGAVFSAVIVPSKGGETAWADMRAAYDALSPAMKARIAGLSAFHSLRHSQGKLGHTHGQGSEYSGYGMTVQDAPLRPLVKLHPETGQPALMIGRHVHGVPGLEPEQSERLLEELEAFACRPPRVVEHRWRAGDAVVWDNRRLMHRARPWDMRLPRVMYHSRIAGDALAELARSR